MTTPTTHDHLELIVRGCSYKLPSRLIELYPNSYFYKLLEHQRLAETQALELDLDQDIFESVVSFMRCRGALPWFKDAKASQDFLTALHFFCLVSPNATPSDYLFGFSMTPAFFRIGDASVPCTWRICSVSSMKKFRPALALIAKSFRPLLTLEGLEAYSGGDRPSPDTPKWMPWLKLYVQSLTDTVVLDKLMMAILYEDWKMVENMVTPAELKKLERLTSCMDLAGMYRLKEVTSQKWSAHVFPEFSKTQALVPDEARMEPECDAICVDYYDYHPGEGLWTWRHGQHRHSKNIEADEFTLQIIYSQPSFAIPFEIDLLPYGHTLDHHVDVEEPVGKSEDDAPGSRILNLRAKAHHPAWNNGCCVGDSSDEELSSNQGSCHEECYSDSHSEDCAEEPPN